MFRNFGMGVLPNHYFGDIGKKISSVQYSERKTGYGSFSAGTSASGGGQVQSYSKSWVQKSPPSNSYSRALNCAAGERRVKVNYKRGPTGLVKEKTKYSYKETASSRQFNYTNTKIYGVKKCSTCTKTSKSNTGRVAKKAPARKRR